MIKCGQKNLVFGERTFIMGIVNVTPNSFSDGGDFYVKDQAVGHAQRLYEEGADIIDIGGVSTAPNASFVSENEEVDRVIPVIESLVAKSIDNISIDTKRAKVAELALLAGASWINDQSAGLFDDAMPLVMARADAVVIMHDGDGADSGVDAGEDVAYEDLLSDIAAFFSRRIKSLKEARVSEHKIIVDPGIGFGKGAKHSLDIINNMHRFSKQNLIGLSRKSFIGKILGIPVAKDRDFASLGAHAAAIFSGASIVRTHRVKETVQMARMLDQCIKAKRGSNEDLYQERR